MPAHVRQRLLGRAVEREPRLGGELARLAADRQLDAVAEALGERARAPGSSSPRSAEIAERASLSPLAGEVVGALDRRDHLRVGAAVAREQPRALELQRERRQRVREHVVHVARERGCARPARRPAACASRDSRSSSTSASASSRPARSCRISRMTRNHGMIENSSPADLVAGLVDDDRGHDDLAAERERAERRRGPQRQPHRAMITTR